MSKSPKSPPDALRRAARVAKNHRSAAFQDGLAMRSQVLGPDYVQRAFESADELSLPFQELATEFAWAEATLNRMKKAGTAAVDKAKQVVSRKPAS